MTERDIHVVLVQEIEKYPVLYNYKLAEYSRKDITEKAWSEISKKTSLSIADCKEKWRNIRSTFLRSLKTPSSGSKPKKPYYLKDYLEFILPYVKPVNESPKCGNISSVDEGAEEEQATRVPSDCSLNQPTEEALEDSTLEDPTASDISRTHGTRRRRTSDIDVAMKKVLNKKMDKTEDTQKMTKNQSVMHHFFLSLLPEFDDMSNQQMRTFKIRVLQLLEDINKEETQGIPSTSTSRNSYSSQLNAFSPISSVASPAPVSNLYTSPSNETPETSVNFSAHVSNWFTE